MCHKIENEHLNLLVIPLLILFNYVSGCFGFFSSSNDFSIAIAMGFFYFCFLCNGPKYYTWPIKLQVNFLNYKLEYRHDSTER